MLSPFQFVSLFTICQFVSSCIFQTICNPYEVANSNSSADVYVYCLMCLRVYIRVCTCSHSCALVYTNALPRTSACARIHLLPLGLPLHRTQPQGDGSEGVRLPFMTSVTGPEVRTCHDLLWEAAGLGFPTGFSTAWKGSQLLLGEREGGNGVREGGEGRGVGRSGW